MTKKDDELEYDDGLEIDVGEMRDLDEGYRTVTVPSES